jgi:hypothetical protein
MNWISVKDKLPGPDEEVIICEMKFGNRHANVHMGWINSETGKWDCASWYGITRNCESNADYYEVTHWMELPESPKVIEK